MATATGTTRTAPTRRAEALRLPRTTGAVSGLLIVILGVWGGLIPFIGPYFHYAFGGLQKWHFTSERLWLDIVPGAVAVIGGLMLMRASTRVGGLTAGWVALAAGVWFAIAPPVSLLWHHTIYAIGVPYGGHTRQMLEWIGYFSGLGVTIVGLAAFAMGRYFSRPRVVEEAAVVAGAAGADAIARHERRDPVTREPVAGDPVAREPVAGDPVTRDPAIRETAAAAPAEHAAVADEPAGVADERGTVADERGGAAVPAEGAAAADVPAERGQVPTVPSERAAVAPADAPADSPAAEARASDSPTTVAPAAQPVATRRRSGGLLGRFRR